MIGRRPLLLFGGAMLLARPALATPAEVAALIAALPGGAAARPDPRLLLDVAAMVENGNAVGLVVGVDEPLPPERRVLSLHVFAGGNPQPEVVRAHFGPAAARPRLSTRMRLATSQTVVAAAVLSDGACWTAAVDLIVTLAACLE